MTCTFSVQIPGKNDQISGTNNATQYPDGSKFQESHHLAPHLMSHTIICSNSPKRMLSLQEGNHFGFLDLYWALDS